jgi:hypothetical protein
MGKAYPLFASAGLAPLTLLLTRDPYLNTFGGWTECSGDSCV